MSTIVTAKNGSDTTTHGAAADRYTIDQPYSSSTGAASITRNSVHPAACSAALAPAGRAISEMKFTPSASSLATDAMVTCAPTRSSACHLRHTNAHAATSTSSSTHARRRTENIVTI